MDLDELLYLGAINILASVPQLDPNYIPDIDYAIKAAKNVWNRLCDSPDK